MPILWPSLRQVELVDARHCISSLQVRSLLYLKHRLNVCIVIVFICGTTRKLTEYAHIILRLFLSFFLSRTHTHTHTNVTCRINPDYVSPRITEALIQRGRRSCFMIDKKGFLPAHVACSRHCSPEKLDMLLRVNPDSLFAITSSGDTLLSLATKTATKSHPNYALINDIRNRLDLSTAAAAAHPSRVSSTDSSEQGTNSRGTEGFGSSFGSTSYNEATSPMAQVRQPKCKRKRKRKITIDDQDTRTAIKTEVSEQANLLLHFSRHMDDDVGKYIAQV